MHTGYDTAYLTDAVGKGKAGVDYYTGEAGEPPGYWQGAGARALGLTGLIGGDDEAGKASAAVMKRLYHEDVGPDGQVLARRQRPGKYQAGSLEAQIKAEIDRQVAQLGRFAQPEEIRAIRLQVRAKLGRNRVPFYDWTYSAPKSVSVLWASLLHAAAEAEAAGDEAEAERLTERAGLVRDAVRRANDRMIAVAERNLAYVRTGHHSKTSGEWRDADGLLVASFPQHTNRDGDPQLHVHNAVANRVQRADKAESGDEKWRALDATPAFRNKLRLGTLGDRFLAQELEELGELRMARREDGKALEVGGISDEAAEAFSGRVREVQAMARELALRYEQKHGHAPGKQAWFKIKQEAATRTRDLKDHNPPKGAQEVAAWAGKAKRSGAGKLSSLREAAEAYAAEHGPSELPGEAERRSLIRQAIAGAQKVNATWDRSQLTLELGLVLPPLPAEVDPEAYLAGLVDEAVSGRAEGVNVIQVGPAPDLIDVSRLGLRKDGTSIYRPPAEERFATDEHVDREEWLLRAALVPVPQRVTPQAAEAALAGTDLDSSQRAACAGLLTSRRLINCLVAPAGTGKTHVMAAFARAWTAETGGRVIGLTASENAARVMAGEGLTTAFNIAKFLGKIKGSDETRGHMEIYPGDVLVVDEATQVSTEDALRIVQVARQSGAMVIGAFDPAQLGAVDAGGIFPLIAARHRSWELTEVRRFRHAWERAASLRLREGDIAAVAEYDARGRVYHGPRDRVYDDAVMLWSNDFLRGLSTLLLAASNEEAAELARLARERLIRLGRISGANEVTLADGNHAGTGDLVRARLNTRIDADGQTLANRDTIRIEGLAGTGEKRMAVVARQTGPGEWSRPFFVPASYLEKSAELDYAGNIHVAQGRTVDTSHVVAGEGMSRDQLYVGMSRGREKNTLHVPTGAPDPVQPSRAEREAYAAAGIARAAELRRQGDIAGAQAVRLQMPDRPSDRQVAPWEAVVAQIMQRAKPEGTALEQIQAAQDYATNTGHLLQLSEAFWRLDAAPKIDEMVRRRVTPGEYERYLRDPERPAFLQAVREHEIGGRPVPDLIHAITAAPLTGARSIAGVLHGRAGKEPAPERGKTGGWAERTPLEASPAIAAAGQMMDDRQAELGRQLAERPPHWALAAWGVPPPPQESAARRADWEKQAGIVASYREAAGITDPDHPIGPPPSGQAQIREAYQSAVRALRLPDDQALLRAMGRGELEASAAAGAQAAAAARPDVQAEIGERELRLQYAAARADIALGAGDTEAAAAAEAEAGGHADELARLAVADAARREWAEANAGKLAAARDAEAELRRRDQAERVAQASEAAPEPHAETDEEFRARLPQIVAEAEARYAASKDGAEPEPEASAAPETQAETDVYAEIHEDLAAIGEGIRELSDLMDAEAARRAEAQQEILSEPAAWQARAEAQAQAEAATEASWQPGDTAADAGQAMDGVDMEAEI
jgi:conjugative relaxase-like TrwC/TraI family protein